MPLIPPVINSAMDAAFVAGMKAMAAYSTGAEGTQDNSKDAIIAAGAAAFAGVAGPAITAYIKSATVLPGITVATAGSPAAQTGATTGPGVIA
jgi:hypothetical protein